MIQPKSVLNELFLVVFVSFYTQDKYSLFNSENAKINYFINLANVRLFCIYLFYTIVLR